MWNYTDETMDHFLNPRNAGEMPDADATGQVGSIVCGDALKLMLKIDRETGRITHAQFLTFGCGSAIASASALTEMVKGKTLDEAAALTDEDVANHLGGLPPEKMHCSVMGTDALRAAIANYRGETPDAPDSEEEIVCRCFGVTRKKIEEVARRHNLTTVEDITRYTKAGGACGSCKGRIAEIIAGFSPRKMTNIERLRRVEAALESEIRPAIRADGGDIELIDIDGTNVTVTLKGRCASCHMAGATLRDFVEARLREEVDSEIRISEAQ